jgi:hypothetical protein
MDDLTLSRTFPFEDLTLPQPFAQAGSIAKIAYQAIF